MKIYPLGLVGESNYQSAIKRTNAGEVARIFHETGNPYDKLALRVENDIGEVIGYIARTSWLRDAVHEQGRGCAATIKEVHFGPDGLAGVVLDVTLTDDPIFERQYQKSPTPKRRRPTATEAALALTDRKRTEQAARGNTPAKGSMLQRFVKGLISGSK